MEQDANIVEIYNYPVKGLSPNQLDGEIELTKDCLISSDRRYGLAYICDDLDLDDLEWVVKSRFLNLVNCPGLAKLGIVYDEASNYLQITRKKKRVAHANLDDPSGRIVMDNFFNAWLLSQPSVQHNNKAIRFVDISKRSHGFTDHCNAYISMINLASVGDLMRVLDQEPGSIEVDPIRFRGNIYVDSWPAWYEFSLVGKVINIGNVKLEVVERIGRCKATSINPFTAQSDVNIPRMLRKGFGHTDMGVYCRVIESGTIEKNMRVSVARA